MTNNCDICGRFFRPNGQWVCDKCIPVLDKELQEAEQWARNRKIKEIEELKERIKVLEAPRQ